MENAQLESGSQEAIDTIIFSLVVGRTAYAYSVDMDQLVQRGVDDPCSRGEVWRPSTHSISKSNVLIYHSNLGTKTQSHKRFQTIRHENGIIVLQNE